ncbi:MAG TPA: hypothetical protein VH969_15055 [Actinophytocola sp.]|uniref:hypothetical protein n=1 Tax=Actinophytocola sp. TaxID=1872138 RepID=UPI002F95549D
MSVLLAFAVGALGNLVGAAVTGTGLVWNVTLTECLYYVLGNVLSLMIVFMLGVLIRASAAAIAIYFVYWFLLPTIFGLLATSVAWFRDVQPWVDFQYAQSSPVQLRGCHDWRAVGQHRCHWTDLAARPVDGRSRIRDEVK